MTTRSEGLLLHSIPYLGNHRILKVLTPDEGLLSFIAKHVDSKKGAFRAIANPFVLAEWVYSKDNRDIHLLKEGSLIDDFSSLKTDYARLQTAGQMAQDLLKTQMPGKKAIKALELTLACFRKLSLFKEPALLGSLFRLKLMTLEGILNLNDHCSQCENEFSYIHEGEVFCHQDRPSGALSFSPLEISLLKNLYVTRSFQELSEMKFEKSLGKKIDLLFENGI